MIVSIHVPKAAGSHLRRALARRYGRRLALYYGPDDARTHPLARRPAAEFDARMIADLEAAGIAILHGHVPARHMARALPDPSRYWIFVREPVERTVSHYHFLQRPAESANPLARTIVDNRLSLTQFAALDRIRRFQGRYCEPFGLAEFGFVGVSELMPLLLPERGLRDLPARGNVNHGKPMVDWTTRRALAATLGDDLALYSEAMALVMGRLGTSDTGTSALYRLGRILPRPSRTAAHRRPEETA